MATGDVYIKRAGVYTRVTPHIYRGARGEANTALYIVDRNQLSGELVQPLPIFIRDPICFANLGEDWSRLWVYDRNKLPVNVEVVWWSAADNFALIYVPVEIFAPEQLNWFKTDYKAGNSVNPSIGAIGSAPGLACWSINDNIKSFFHLCQDVTGGNDLLCSVGNVDATTVAPTDPFPAPALFDGLPALAFNGLDQHFLIVDPYDALPTDTFALFSAYHNNNNPRIENGAQHISAHYTGDDVMYCLGYDTGSADEIRGGFHKNAVWSQVELYRPDKTVWHHLQTHYNKVRLQLWLDGANVHDISKTATLTGNDSKVYIGRRYNTRADPAEEYNADYMHYAAILGTSPSELENSSWFEAHAETFFTVYLGEAAPAGWEPIIEVYHKHKGTWRVGAGEAYLPPVSAIATSESGDRTAWLCYTGPGVGHPDNCSWMSDGIVTPQKVNADFGDPQAFVYFEFNNFCLNAYTHRGVKDLVIYGTNELSAYQNLTPGDYTDLTQLATATLTERDTGAVDCNTAVFERVDVDPAEQSNPYRYIVIECLNCFDPIESMGLSKINAYVKVPDYGS